MKSARWFLVLIIWSASVSAGVQFTATTERTSVVPGEQVVISAELVCDRQVKGMAPPPVSPSDAFAVIKTGQNQSTTSSIQIINGRTSQTNEIHYVFQYVIVPKKAGPFVFPALSVTVDNTAYSTQAISFNATAEPVKNQDVRASITISKQPLYPGEQAILTFKVAQRGNAPVQVDHGFEAAVATIEKSFGKEFSLSRLFTNQVTSSAERLGGEMYRTFSLRWALIPLSSGQIAVPPIAFAYSEIKQVRRRNEDPFFDDFFGGAFGGGMQAIGRTAFSNELPVRVKELPPPPAGFSGCIGKLGITASIEPPTIPAGEAATLKINLVAATRPGSVAEIAAPKIANCEVFTPERHVEVDTTPAGITTRKSYKYLVIPGQEGAVTVSPIELAYFDPGEGVYKKASSGALSLFVTAGKGGKKPQTRYLTQEEIREVGTDIRYIKTDVSPRNVTEKPFREPIFFLLYPLPFAIFLFALLYRVQSQRRESNADFYLRKRALRSAHKTLSQVRSLGAKIPSAAFLGKVTETLERYISQKCGFAATGRTLEELKGELLERTADERIVSDLTKFIELLDSYRFGGASFDEKSRSALLDRASAFLAGLEKSAKKAKKSLLPPTAALSLLAIILFGSTSVFSAPTNLWFERGNKFYAEQQYDSAVAYYEKIVTAGISSSVVYFNLGNAYFRLKKIGYARLCYEKAARLDPADRDVAANIRFVSSAIVDRVPEPQRGFLETVFWRLHILMPLRLQLWFCFGLLLVISLLTASALFTQGNNRLWLIYLSTLLGIILFAGSLSTGIKIYDAEKSAYAILLEPSIDAKNEPEGNKILFTAHEGTKFQIRKSVEGWSLVSLPNGVSGWVENKALGRM